MQLWILILITLASVAVADKELVLAFADSDVTGRIDSADALGRQSSPTVAQEPSSVPTGKLTIVGEAIDHVVLIGEDGTSLQLDPCTVPAEVSAGRYWCRILALKGAGHVVHPISVGSLVVNVPPDGQVSLKLGAPLNHQVLVVRRARGVVQLQYKLLGQGGEVYSIKSVLPNAPPPALVVYKDGKAIFQDRFRFG